MWKRWLMLAAMLGVVIGGAWLALPETDEQHDLLQEGRLIPFTLPDLAGNPQASPSDGVILLNFWATWCPPCRKEMPSMAALQRRYGERGLKVVAVSVDRNRSDLASFVHEYNLPFTVLHDPDSKISHQYGVFRYPETFLVDRQGKIRFHVAGAMDWMADDVTKVIEGMLNEPGAAGQAG